MEWGFLHGDRSVDPTGQSCRWSIGHRLRQGEKLRRRWQTDPAFTASKTWTVRVSHDGVTRSEPSEQPLGYKLNQNLPNPFNPLTVIEFEIPHSAEVRLDVLDALGRRVAELANGQYDTENTKPYGTRGNSQAAYTTQAQSRRLRQDHQNVAGQVGEFSLPAFPPYASTLSPLTKRDRRVGLCVAIATRGSFRPN